MAERWRVGLTVPAGRCYQTPVRSLGRADGLVVALGVLLAACSTGSTEVQGVEGQAAGDATASTGATAATGPTVETAETDAFGGPVELDFTQSRNPTGAAMYSCDGIEGTWTYDPGTGLHEGLRVEDVIEIAEVDMSGGSGTLVFQAELDIPGEGSGTITYTVDLQVTGTAEAPTMESSGIHVDASGIFEGVPIESGGFFPEDQAFPIIAGSTHC